MAAPRVVGDEVEQHAQAPLVRGGDQTPQRRFAAVAWLAELFPDPKQREKVIGYTQAFSSLGGFMVSLMALAIAKTAPKRCAM